MTRTTTLLDVAEAEPSAQSGTAGKPLTDQDTNPAEASTEGAAASGGAVDGPDTTAPEDGDVAGRGAAYAAAMDLAVDGHHSHYVASGETECLTGDCGFSVAGQLLNGVL